MATPAQWIAGARPRTLPAALAPVLVGTGAAVALGGFDVVAALLALAVALALQVAVNYANDYSDGTRGTDAVRVGPMRLVGSGAAPSLAELRTWVTGRLGAPAAPRELHLLDAVPTLHTGKPDRRAAAEGVGG